MSVTIRRNHRCPVCGGPMPGQAQAARVTRSGVLICGSAVCEERADDIFLPHAPDLRVEAVEAIGRGEMIRVVSTPHHANPSLLVETLVIEAPGGASGDVGRAGQVTNGDAVWGDWSEADQTIATDEGITLRLDGREERACEVCGKTDHNEERHERAV